MKLDWLRYLVELVQEHRCRRRQLAEQETNEYLQFWRNR